MDKPFAITLDVGSSLANHTGSWRNERPVYVEVGGRWMAKPERRDGRPEVKADVAKEATPRVEAQVKKTFETHPQLVGKLDGAPDPDAKAEAYRKFLKGKGVTGAAMIRPRHSAATGMSRNLVE